MEAAYRPVTDERMTAVGFQTADVRPFAEEVSKLSGVTGVWILPMPDDRGCTVWVAVQGLTDKGYENRLAVLESIERFIESRQVEMRLSRFLFDYYVTVDDPELGAPQVPKGAIPIATSTSV